MFMTSGRFRQQSLIGAERSRVTLVCCWVILITLCALVGTTRVHAGGGPENLAVVVNADSWASLTVANHYIQLRQVPPSNVVYLSGLPSFEQIDVDTFREKILVPVFKTLNDRDLLEHIDYIVYSADFPTTIDMKKDLGGAEPAKPLTPLASITSMTYLFQAVLQKSPLALDLHNNFYTRRPILELNASPRTLEDKQQYQQAAQLAEAKKWDEAIPLFEAIISRVPNNAMVQYNYACCLSRVGKLDEAIKALELAVAGGWVDSKHTQADADLETLRNLPAFQDVLKKMEAKATEPIDIQPTLAFSTKYLWDASGSRVEENGIRYVLSTMLAVTSGRGNSVAEAIDYLKRSAAADATGPTGTVYYMRNADVRSTTRQWGFVTAVKLLEGTSVRGAIVEGKLPEKKDDVAGVMAGSDSFDWKSSASTILPGAICEHLTSFGGMLREGAGQTPLSEFLRYGAAGASGTVVEPYALQQKFPTPFIHVHYARGCSLAESFYQSVFGPFQLLIVGDALCQPWAKRVTVEVQGLQPNQTITAPVSVEPKVSDAAAVDHFDFFVNGKRVASAAPGNAWSLDPEKLTSGWHELRVVAVGTGPIETRSRMLVPLLVNPQDVDLSLVREKETSGDVVYGDPLVVRVKAAKATSISVTHNGRVLGTVDGPTGTISIDTRTLGMGPVTLQAITRASAATSFSAPLNINVLPPALLGPTTGIKASDLLDGIEVKLGSKEPAIVSDTKTGDWLDKLSPGADQPLILNAFFDAPADRLYQLQFEGNSIESVRVDGESVWQIEKDANRAVGWTMVPLNLKKGLHRFIIKGTTARKPTLQLRFGDAGCQAWIGTRFKHKK